MAYSLSHPCVFWFLVWPLIFCWFSVHLLKYDRHIHTLQYILAHRRGPLGRRRPVFLTSIPTLVTLYVLCPYRSPRHLIHMAHSHSHDGGHVHDHSHSHADGAGHGHTHEIMDGPGSYMGRAPPIVEGRDW